MKSLTKKVSYNESKIWLLLTGIFVFSPILLWFLSRLDHDISQQDTCKDITYLIIGLHICLILIIPLAKLISWKKIYFVVLFFSLVAIVAFLFHYQFGSQIMNFFIVSGVYHSLYLFGIKGCFEVWNHKKDKIFFLKLLLASPLLIIIGITCFFSVFLVISCF